MKKTIGLLLGVLYMGSASSDDGLFSFEFEQLAPGVWAGVRTDSPRFPVMGNATFVISSEGVVVFDGGGMPTMSEQLIEEIRSLTDKPVTHVVTSHWHGDHNFGVFRFAEEYPDVQFVAHEFTRDVMNSSRINYIDRGPGFVERNRVEFEKIIESGVDSEGNTSNQVDRDIYKRILADGEAIEADAVRAKVTPPDIVFTERYVIESGDRTIELLHLGHANTAGDIVMWLPDERIVATGDIVVLPSPYAFNMPPRPWAQTLRNLNELDYNILVPGHGEVQRNADYVDLLIEVADTIANQRDDLLAQDKTVEEVQELLDFSAFEDRFTHGDVYVAHHYNEWFEQPFRAAAMKALTGEPMVEIAPPVSVPFADEGWRIEAAEHEVVDHLGEQALRLKGGAAVLPDLDIANAMIEFDIAVTEERGFAGLVFRLQDDANFEHFYVRPHQSGNPDANQYTPVINGVSAWQLYHGPGYSTPVEYRFNDWIHIKVIYAGSQARVYIDSDEPVLYVEDLKRDTHGGGIGVHSANFSAVHFANFEYTQLANAYGFPARSSAAVEAPAGLIKNWQVSNVFDGSILDGVARLGQSQTADLSWVEVAAEAGGITNLAEAGALGEGRNTVFARIVVEAESPGKKRLALGYSDAASVYVNGALVYQGDNTYMSRDYRYLGTIGLFDSVVVPLQAGENEVWVAVSEAFGGWGIMGTLTELK